MLLECGCGFYSLCCGHVVFVGEDRGYVCGYILIRSSKWDYVFLCVYHSILMLSSLVCIFQIVREYLIYVLSQYAGFSWFGPSCKHARVVSVGSYILDMFFNASFERMSSLLYVFHGAFATF
jgi:hypothetical protein